MSPAEVSAKKIMLLIGKSLALNIFIFFEGIQEIKLCLAFNSEWLAQAFEFLLHF